MSDDKNVLLLKPDWSRGPTLVYTPTDRATDGERRASILMVHGWKSTFGTTFGEIKNTCLTLGCNVFMLTLRGHGDATETIQTVTREDHMLDIELALRYMKRQHTVDMSKLVGVGSSYGAYLLAVAATEQPFMGLLLRAPALYPNDGWNKPIQQMVDMETLWEWRSQEHIPEDSRALVGIAAHKGKLLVVSGGKDEDMPPQVALSYGNVAYKANMHRIILSQAGHVFAGESREAYLRYSSAWLEGLLASPSL